MDSVSWPDTDWYVPAVQAWRVARDLLATSSPQRKMYIPPLVGEGLVRGFLRLRSTSLKLQIAVVTQRLHERRICVCKHSRPAHIHLLFTVHEMILTWFACVCVAVILKHAWAGDWSIIKVPHPLVIHCMLQWVEHWYSGCNSFSRFLIQSVLNLVTSSWNSGFFHQKYLLWNVTVPAGRLSRWRLYISSYNSCHLISLPRQAWFKWTINSLRSISSKKLLFCTHQGHWFKKKKKDQVLCFSLSVSELLISTVKKSFSVAAEGFPNTYWMARSSLCSRACWFSLD